MNQAPVPQRRADEINEQKPIRTESPTIAEFKRRVEEKSPITAVYVQNVDRIERIGTVVQIFLTNPTHLSLLEAKDHKSALDSVAAELFGKGVSVSLIMKEPQNSGGAVENVKDEPLVKRFLEVFRGDLAQVKPAKGE